MVAALKPGDRLKELGEGHHFAAHIAEVITVSVRMVGVFHVRVRLLPHSRQVYVMLPSSMQVADLVSVSS